MPQFTVECVSRETGETEHRVYDAATTHEVRGLANDDGFLAGPIHELPPAPPPPAFSPGGPYPFRPTFSKHFAPKIAKGMARSALVVAVLGPVLVMMLVMIQLGDPASPGVWFATVVAGLLSTIPFAIIAVQVRLWAELVSILFDIFRLLQEVTGGPAIKG